MKIYPEQQDNELREPKDKLSGGEQLLRKLAILIAFISVFAFFLKIVFL